LEEGTEDGRKVSGCDAGAVVDQSPHKLSNIIVLVFSELASFVRTILQEEQNEGVELTEHPCNGSKEPHMQWREKRHESLRKEHVQDSSGSRSEIEVGYAAKANVAACSDVSGGSRMVV